MAGRQRYDAKKFEAMEEFGVPEEEALPDAHSFNQEMGLELPEGHVAMWPQGKKKADKPFRLKVQLFGDEGERLDMGYMPPGAGQEHLIAKYKKPGIYILTPVDEFGQEADSPIKQNIPANHPMLLAHRQGEVSPLNMAAMMQPQQTGIDPTIVSLFKAELAEAHRQRDEAAKLVKEMHAHYAQELDKLSKDRMSLAVDNASSALDMQAQVLERAQRRDDDTQMKMTNLFTAQQQMTQQAFQLQMEQLRISAENERMRQSRELEMEKQRMEREREERRELLEREREERKIQAERERQDNERRMTMERELVQQQRANDQAFFERTLAIQQKQGDPLAQFASTMQKLGPLTDGIKGIFGMPAEEETKGKGWLESIMGLVPVIINAQVEMSKAKALAQIPQYEEEEYEDAPQQQQQYIPQYPQQPQMQQQMPQQVQQPVAPPAPPVVVVPVERPLMDLVAERAMPLPPKTQKAARKAIKVLVGSLSHAAQSEWLATIMEALQACPEALDYLKAVGIKTSLLEAGATEAMVTSIVSFVDSSGLVPSDIPRF
jgi:hypothetical protein